MQICSNSFTIIIFSHLFQLDSTFVVSIFAFRLYRCHFYWSVLHRYKAICVRINRLDSNRIIVKHVSRSADSGDASAIAADLFCRAIRMHLAHLCRC